GQKCTAVRRVIVPEGLKEPVITALANRLGDKGTVGAYDAEGTTKGALYYTDQHRDVYDDTQQLVDAVGKVRLGGPENVSSYADAGSLYPQTILELDDADTDAVHSVEEFGAVPSVIRYDGTAGEATRLAARGAGSLVATVCSDDPVFV